MHAQSCKSHCTGGVRVALGGRFVAVIGGSAFRELHMAL